LTENHQSWINYRCGVLKHQCAAITAWLSEVRGSWDIHVGDANVARNDDVVATPSREADIIRGTASRVKFKLRANRENASACYAMIASLLSIFRITIRNTDFPDGYREIVLLLCISMLPAIPSSVLTRPGDCVLRPVADMLMAVRSPERTAGVRHTPPPHRPVCGGYQRGIRGPCHSVGRLRPTLRRITVTMASDGR
jgi:hypothetical protein